MCGRKLLTKSGEWGLGAENVEGPKIRNRMKFAGAIYLYKSGGIYVLCTIIFSSLIKGNGPIRTIPYHHFASESTTGPDSISSICDGTMIVGVFVLAAALATSWTATSDIGS